MSRDTPGYRTVLTAAALRSLQTVPPRVAEPLVAFVFGSLAQEPKRRGKPLQGELTGRWAARRGDYRIIYRLDDDAKAMYILKIARRADVYRSR
ncbi:MAG TPA: type II toxin-antitoxin system RelE/ParE family toxin [Jatrophihabitans sp.]|uniref:type II toxin-antitoxin system RelE family toxin n=1 Tax=Jatrophihabitans sp. TaxID=1932789 RepID=UPI002EE0B2AF